MHWVWALSVSVSGFYSCIFFYLQWPFTLYLVMDNNVDRYMVPYSISKLLSQFLNLQPLGTSHQPVPQTTCNAAPVILFGYGVMQDIPAFTDRYRGSQATGSSLPLTEPRSIMYLLQIYFRRSPCVMYLPLPSHRNSGLTNILQADTQTLQSKIAFASNPQVRPRDDVPINMQCANPNSGK